MDVPLLEKRLAEIVARLGLLRFQREGELQRLRAARDQKGEITASNLNSVKLRSKSPN